MVGAIVAASDGTIVGDGYHRRAGAPHAEVHALEAAGERARGAVLYCTLEPCSHTGRTGPCAERIVAAGIRRVVAAATDPNPRVAGGGFAYLRAHGVDVEGDIAHRQAARQNAAFFTFMRSRRPFVVFKAAVSLDGRIAVAPATTTPISGPEAHRQTQRLRAEVDAIGIGAGTLLADDPLLTVRDVYRERPFTRVIFDRRLRTPPSARLFGTRAAGPIVVADEHREVAGGPEGRGRTPAGGGADRGARRPVDWGGPAEARRPWRHVPVARGRRRSERGRLGCGYDRPCATVRRAHQLGEGGVPLLAGRALTTAALHDRRVEPCGDDVLIEGDVYRID